MTAQGMRRTRLLAALAACALLGWWLWPRHATGIEQATAAASASAHGRAGPPTGDAGRDARPPTLDARPNATAGGDGDGDVVCLAEQHARLRNIRDALDPSRSAKDAFAHALLGGWMALSLRDEDAQRREEVRLEAEWQAARRRWPNDLDIAWRAANDCHAKFGCDEDKALDHLLQLDPDNASVWWLAMREAWARGDGTAYDAALAHAAAARGSDPRVGAAFLALQPLLAAAPTREACLRADDTADAAKLFGHPPTASDWAEIEAWSYELAGNTVISGASFLGCRESEVGHLTQRRRADCIATLSTLAGGDMLIEQTFGLPLLIQLEGDSPQGLAARERYRQLLYLFLVQPPGLMARDPAAMLSMGELEAMRRAAIARHRWPPPADWLPGSPRLRALLARGTLPQ
jgi:hypothetical protein